MVLARELGKRFLGLVFVLFLVTLFTALLLDRVALGLKLWLDRQLGP